MSKRKRRTIKCENEELRQHQQFRENVDEF